MSQEYYKRLISQNKTEQLCDELLDQLNKYNLEDESSKLSKYFDNLIMLTGRLKSINQERNLNIISNEDANVENAKINNSLLSLLNQLPSYFFDFINGGDVASNKSIDIRKNIVEYHRDSNFEYDAFFSYSSEDWDTAKSICEELRGFGLKIFLSGEALKSNIGSSFFEKIERALRSSEHFILLCTSDSMNSEWVKTEYETFYNEYFIPSKGKRKLLITKGGNYNPEDVPILLRRLQIADSPKDIINTFLISNNTTSNKINNDLENEIEIVEKSPDISDSSKIEKEKITEQNEHSSWNIDRQNFGSNKSQKYKSKLWWFIKFNKRGFTLVGFILISSFIISIYYWSSFFGDKKQGVRENAILPKSEEPEKGVYTGLMTSSGYKYNHIRTGGKKVKEGDYVYITISIIGSDGTVLQEIDEGPDMPVMHMPTAEKPLSTPNPVIDMLMNGGLEDSMTLIFPIDSLPIKNNPQVVGMEFLEYAICIKKIQDETAYKNDIEAKRLLEEKEIEDVKARMTQIEIKVEQILKDYNSGKLNVQSTTNGLNYIIHEQGDGQYGVKDKRATVHYYGVFMDGKMLDSSFKNGKPYTFTVGRGEVIQGWDLGIPLLKKGGKASFFIPYSLAYGIDGNPPTIPEKTDLMFYVELVDVD